ncbi:hypothetical protein H1V43_32295 [Streptomyces sp. PSKA54]|uniref:Uncharacterized protein n=1 Tax=Streptomyces himalayensis subsp. aureolus TaxID=2758039 RepID=A0A7W2D7L6_9ACTN|nr:hypothetical protein [Streptomyces himalayensis]MBA4865945.1 hypothetical protein [Streptomyces himalayensis subsp. aureolus]
MDVDAVLRLLAINPSQLEPAPPIPPQRVRAGERLGFDLKPCVSCGQPATCTQIVDITGHGHRWLDRCTRCFLACVAQGDGPRVPVEETLAALADAAREAGVRLTVITDP